MSYYLALDTATEACSVALSLDGRIHARFEIVDRSHTQRLLPMVKDLLAEIGRPISRLDGIACGIGPGSFAGVRIGVGVVKGLALAADLPVVGVSSLAMLAQGAHRRFDAPRVVAVIDARMKEVYVGTYELGADKRMQALIPDRVCPATDAPRLAGGPWAAAGTGWGPYEAALRVAIAADLAGIDACALPDAADALTLGIPVLQAGRGNSADGLVPAYLRDRVALTLLEQQARKA